MSRGTVNNFTDRFSLIVEAIKMHHAIHRIGGSMALKFCRAADLERWAKALRALADERVAEAEAADHEGGT